MELLSTRPDVVLKLVFHSHGAQNAGVQMLREQADKLNIPTEENDKAIRKISMKENTYVVGIFKKYETNLSPETNHVVLHQARNMGNIGTIIRTMLGFGTDDLALISPSADVFHPRLVRATMGAIFQMRIAYFPDIETYMQAFPDRNLYMAYVDENSRKLQETDFEPPYSLVFGNEGRGLPEEIRRLGQSFHIPQSERIESLNLSVAVAMTLWEAYRDS